MQAVLRPVPAVQWQPVQQLHSLPSHYWNRMVSAAAGRFAAAHLFHGGKQHLPGKCSLTKLAGHTQRQQRGMFIQTQGTPNPSSMMFLPGKQVMEVTRLPSVAALTASALREGCTALASHNQHAYRFAWHAEWECAVHHAAGVPAVTPCPKAVSDRWGHQCVLWLRLCHCDQERGLHMECHQARHLCRNHGSLHIRYALLAVFSANRGQIAQ